MKKNINHAERDHSKFSASGSERWLNCAASVALEESMPDKNNDTFWSLEGTKAHEVLEHFLLSTRYSDVYNRFQYDISVDDAMLEHCERAANFIKKLANKHGVKYFVETRVLNTFIHPEMFGTIDSFIPVYGEKLYVIDFKYGQGHIVDPEENTQLIQYALGIAESYDWDFKTVEVVIIQPRSGGAKIHKSWELTMYDLKNKWLPLWQKGVARVESGKSKPFVGAWCYWCKAKAKCPAKIEKSLSEVTNAFASNPLPEERVEHGKEKSKKEKGHRKEIEWGEI